MPRRLGQHYLIRQSVLERIASAACPQKQPLVIEIGPGRGALTRPLLARAERVIAIELDERLAAHLRSRFADEPRLEVLHADVLTTDLAAWGPAAVAGNLPYYITSPILDRIAAARHILARAVLLMQKEVAGRVAASPGGRDYGFLSVKTRLWAQPELLFAVPPAAFHPPPKVDSAALLLRPAPRDPNEYEPLLAFLSACFHQKRKNLRNNLAGSYPREILDRLPEARMRAEQLSLDQLAALRARLETALRESKRT